MAEDASDDAERGQVGCNPEASPLTHAQALSESVRSRSGFSQKRGISAAGRRVDANAAFVAKRDRIAQFGDERNYGTVTCRKCLSQFESGVFRH